MKKNYYLNSVLLFKKVLPLLLILLFSSYSAQTGASDDFDGDGISNYDDIDDDNDGILDHIECQTVATLKRYNESGNAIWNGITTVTANRSNNSDITPEVSSGTTSINRIITGSSPSTYTNNFSVTATRETYWQINANSEADQQGFITFAFSTPIPISDVIIVLQDVDYRRNGTAPTITISLNGGTATTQNLIPHKLTSLDLPNSSNTTNGGYNPTTGVISYNVPLLGPGTNDNRAYALIGDSSATVTSVRISYNLDEKAQVFVGRIDTPCDQDNDGLLNHFDLDSDGDGCPDAVEAGVVDYVGSTGMQSGNIKNGSNGSVTSTKTVVESVVSGPYGTNGFASSVENNDTFSAVYKNSTDYTYSQALNSSTSVCCSNFTAGTISGNQNICVGNNTTFSSTQTGGTWSSGNTAIATVNSSGVVTSVAAGTATITYTYDKYNGICPKTATRTVTVTAAPNAGTVSGNQNICVGNNTTFSSTQTGGTWSSGNTAIATVNSSGVVTGVAAGTATITYTVAGTGGCANATATRTVNVTAAPNAGTVSGNQNICVGNNTTFSSTQTGGTWSSGNTAIATVNSSGVVTGVAAGTATITYTVAGTGGCANATATRTVNVSSCVNSDSDNIPDNIDIDDDNDGVLDKVECPDGFVNLVNGGGFATDPPTPNWYYSNSSANYDTSTGAYPFGYSSTQANSPLTGGLFGQLGDNNANTGSLNALMELNGDTDAIVTRLNHTLVAGATYQFSFDVGLRSTTAAANQSSRLALYNADTNAVETILVSEPLVNLPTYPSYKTLSGSFTPAASGNYYLLFLNAGNGLAANDYNIDRVAAIGISGSGICDFDGDGIPNHLDTDSDNDGCSDAKEAGVIDYIIANGGTYSPGTLDNPSNSSSSEVTVGNNTPTDYGTNGFYTAIESNDTQSAAYNGTYTYANAIDSAITACTLFCYKPAITSGTVLDTHKGITSLGRAGVHNSNWPMVRKGGWIALEAKTKGFVPNRLSTAEINAIPAANLVEGMMVYNITLDCLQINTDGTAAGWKCFNTQACP